MSSSIFKYFPNYWILVEIKKIYIKTSAKVFAINISEN